MVLYIEVVVSDNDIIFESLKSHLPSGNIDSYLLKSDEDILSFINKIGKITTLIIDSDVPGLGVLAARAQNIVNLGISSLKYSCTKLEKPFLLKDLLQFVYNLRENYDKNLFCLLNGSILINEQNNKVTYLGYKEDFKDVGRGLELAFSKKNVRNTLRPKHYNIDLVTENDFIVEESDLAGSNQQIDSKIVNTGQSYISFTLTDKEIQILKNLILAPAFTLDKADLLKLVWNYNEEVSTSTLEAHVLKLRQKLKNDLLRNAKTGYMLAVNSCV